MQAEGVSVRAGETVALALRPRQEQAVRVLGDAARSNEVLVELPGGGVTGSYVKVLMPARAGEAADPAISDSGENFVRVPIPPGTDFPLTVRVVGLTNSRSDTAALAARISLTATEPSAARVAEAKTLAAFNRGERLRRSHTGTEEAMTAYREAVAGARAMGDPVLEQRALLSEGRMLMLGGKRYAEAVELERQAVAIDNTARAPSVEAMAWKTLGGALVNTGEYVESLTASRRALALYERTGETYWQGIVLENLGDVLLNLGDLESALGTDERALALARTLRDDFGVVEMLAQMGSIHESRGEYQEALNDFSEAVEVTLPSSYNPMQGEAWLALGQLHQALGERDHAGEDFERALTIARHTASGLDELDALGSLARLGLARGQTQGAQAGFQQALARAVELKAVRPRSALLIGLAETDVALGQRDDAERLLREAVELSASIHQAAETAEAYARLGEVAEARLRWGEAETDFTQAAGLYESIPDKAGMAQADAGLARVERAQGQPENALRRLSAALDIIEGSRASLSPGGLRTRYFATQRATYQQAISLLMELDRAQPKAGYAARAWMVAERAQARSLLDEVSSSGAAGPMDAASQSIAHRLAALDVQIRALQVTLAQTGTAAADLESAARIGGDLRKALLEAEELQSRLGKTAPTGSLGSIDASGLTPARFAAKDLSAQDALIEYWTGDDGSYAWLIGSDGSCSAFRLPKRGELEREIAEYRRTLLARDDRSAGETATRREARVAEADRRADQLAGQLGEALIPKAMLARLGEARRLMVVADGPLAQVPFASLRLAGAGTGYLVERFDLVHEPSAAFRMLADDAPAAPSGPMRVAIFADPVYNRADARIGSAPQDPSAVSATKIASVVRREGDAGDLNHLSRLPGSRREALAIEGIVGQDRTSLFLGFDATPAAVRDLDWSRYGVAHFAAHAIAQPGGRDLSGILLSMLDRRGERRNGVLWLRDIYEPRVARELVVLSGCGTALGETIPGEGMNSLARAFLFSGTRQVAATLWSADDVSAGVLMGDFYRGLMTQGLTAPAALRAAQRALRANPRYAAPYFWSGFMVEGSWKTR